MKNFCHFLTSVEENLIVLAVKLNDEKTILQLNQHLHKICKVYGELNYQYKIADSLK